MSTAVLRRLGPDDWRLFRRVRLAALADAPTTFGSTLARERAFDEADWRVRAAHATVALAGDDPVGVVGWVWVDEPHRADLVAMWVAPSARGSGVGAALVRAVVEEVTRTRRAVLELGVVVDNAPAVALYRAAGFVEVGREVGTRSGDLLLRLRHPAGWAAP